MAFIQQNNVDQSPLAILSRIDNKGTLTFSKVVKQMFIVKIETTRNIVKKKEFVY